MPVFVAFRTIVAVLLVLAATGCASGPRVATMPSPFLGRQLSLTWPSDRGELTTLGPGRPRVVEFWHPNCAPCRTRVSAMAEREAEINAKGAELVLVVVLNATRSDGVPMAQETVQSAREALANWGVNHSFLVARQPAAGEMTGVIDVPEAYVLDEQCRLIWRAPESATTDDIISALP